MIRTDARPAAGGAARWLEAAWRVGRILERDAIWSGDRCAWMGWFVVPASGASRRGLCVTGSDLYAGGAGIAVFLGRLARATGEPGFAALARGALTQALARPSLPSIGAYAGRAGLLHATLAVQAALGDDLGSTARRQLEDLAERPAPACECDIMEGRAGAIRVLLDAHGAHGLAGALTLATRLGDELLAAAERRGEEWTWKPTAAAGRTPLLGYSHGVTGIALALGDLARATGDARFGAAARGGWSYQTRLFNPEAGTWPDLRTVAGAPITGTSTMSAWCNGAPGIALALGRRPDDDLTAEERRQRQIAIAETRALVRPDRLATHGGDFCLCHGVAGGGEILLELSQRLSRPDLAEAAEAAADAGLDLHHDSGAWPCGIAPDGVSPGLMVGLAGIGHHFLRLAHRTTPSPFAL